jgi:hypothetical protein
MIRGKENNKERGQADFLCFRDYRYDKSSAIEELFVFVSCHVFRT